MWSNTEALIKNVPYITALAAKITYGMVGTGKLPAKISFICLEIKVSIQW